jgi:hypothetical protein
MPGDDRRNTGRIPSSASFTTGDCGQRLHAQTRTSRGEQWSYYIFRRCGMSVAGIEAETVVSNAIATMRPPTRHRTWEERLG